MKRLLLWVLGMLFIPLQARAGGFDRAIETLLPRVVKIYGLGVGKEAGYGTGVLVSDDGLVLTVFSLLIDARKVRVVTADGTRYEADVLHRDPKRQLALLKMKPASSTSAEPTEPVNTVGPFLYFDLLDLAGATAVTTKPSLQPGDWVIAAGNPFKIAEGAEPVSIAHGVFSIRTRLDARRAVKDFPYHGDVLVMDAMTSNPGAPGSALVNLDGEFVGMVGRVVTSNLTHTHFNYAMPREVLETFLKEALAPQSAATKTPAESGKGDVASGVSDIGIRLVRAGYQTTPPIVDRVRKGSPADLLGVRKDDLILSLNGHSLKDVRDYDERLATLGAADAVDLIIRRDRQILRIQLKPEQKP